MRSQRERSGASWCIHEIPKDTHPFSITPLLLHEGHAQAVILTCPLRVMPLGIDLQWWCLQRSCSTHLLSLQEKAAVAPFMLSGCHPLDKEMVLWRVIDSPIKLNCVLPRAKFLACCNPALKQPRGVNYGDKGGESGSSSTSLWCLRWRLLQHVDHEATSLRLLYVSWHLNWSLDWSDVHTYVQTQTKKKKKKEEERNSDLSHGNKWPYTDKRGRLLPLGSVSLW